MPIPDEYRPHVALRGERAYVHSTDIYSEVLAAAESAYQQRCDGPMTFTFRELFRRAPRIVFDPEVGGTSNLATTPAVEFSLTISQRRIDGWLIADGAEITERKPYDEGTTRNAAVHDATGATLIRDTGAAPIEVLTALGVAVLNRQRPPASATKWLLGRLQLAGPLRATTASDLRLDLRPGTLGGRARLDASSAGEHVGSMMFLLGSPEPE